MSARIYTAAEAAALLADYTATPRITFGDERLGGVPLCVDGRELCMAPEDPEGGDWLYVDRWEAAMHDAAPGLAETVVQISARADAAEARVETAEAREERATLERDAAQRALANVVAERDIVSADLHRVTMERDGARLSLDAAHEARIKQSLELADARAEVVRLRAALDAAHRLVRRHGNALDAMEEGREAEESAT